MSKQISNKPVALALGAALTGGMLGAGIANAAENPFGLSELGGGYMQVADSHMEGKCGGAKPATTEGKCGAVPDAKAKEGKCGGVAEEKPKAEEGKCGESKCGANMK